MFFRNSRGEVFSFDANILENAKTSVYPMGFATCVMGDEWGRTLLSLSPSPFVFIKYYNEKRIKEKLGWMSPVQYRLNTLA